MHPDNMPLRKRYTVCAVSVTLTPDNTVSAASSSPTPCINTLLTSYYPHYNRRNRYWHSNRSYLQA